MIENGSNYAKSQNQTIQLNQIGIAILSSIPYPNTSYANIIDITLTKIIRLAIRKKKEYK